MTPFQLDAIINGAAVHVYRRYDGNIYASVHNHERFGVSPLETVRVPLTPTSTVDDVLNSKVVQHAIARHSAKDY